MREPDDFDEAFAVMDREPPDAILMVSDSLTVLNRKRVFEYMPPRIACRRFTSTTQWSARAG